VNDDARAAGVLLTARVEVRTIDGQPVVTHLWSTIFPKATTSCAGGHALPDHRFPEECRSRLVGTEVLFIPEDQGETYYLASGDGAPHARFLEAALAEGHPGLILQGMGSLGIVTAAVVRLAGGGDSTRLKRLAVRFSSPVLLGHELEISVFEVQRTDEGNVEVAFEARQADRLCLSHGRATFTSPD
jgi:acyl dehydratase